MPRKVKFGPIGRGWVEHDEKKNVFVAKWQVNVPDEKRPNGCRKVWGGQHVLGPLDENCRKKGAFSSLPKAKEHWEKICDGIMNPSQSLPAHSVQLRSPAVKESYTFERYVDEIWIPIRRTSWNEATKENNEEFYFGTKLFPKWGHRLLTDMRRDEMQEWLDWLARSAKPDGTGYSKTVVQHCLNHLQAIFAHARERGYITDNVAYDLRMPKLVRDEHTPALALEDFGRLLENLPTPKDQLMARLLYYVGVRREELFGLKWKDYNGKTIRVVRQINRHFRRKSKQGNETVPPKNRLEQSTKIAELELPDDVHRDLDEYKRWCGKVSEDGFVFTSMRNTPINSNNWLNRVLKPAALHAGILKQDRDCVTGKQPKAEMSYHMFRRGILSELAAEKEDLTAIQQHARHKNLKTTLDYIKKIRKEQPAAKESLNTLSARERSTRKGHTEKKPNTQ
ncbi:MAG: site-specific integrase [Acidobacteriaceae bacterium]|nr:site-specific integrase [Acidobacteriaceae bacterium]